MRKVRRGGTIQRKRRGAVPLAGDKVNIYFGAGYQWMDDMLKGEISITDRLAEIAKIEF